MELRRLQLKEENKDEPHRFLKRNYALNDPTKRLVGYS